MYAFAVGAVMSSASLQSKIFVFWLVAVGVGIQMALMFLLHYNLDTYNEGPDDVYYVPDCGDKEAIEELKAAGGEDIWNQQCSKHITTARVLVMCLVYWSVLGDTRNATALNQFLILYRENRKEMLAASSGKRKNALTTAGLMVYISLVFPFIQGAVSGIIIYLSRLILEASSPLLEVVLNGVGIVFITEVDDLITTTYFNRLMLGREAYSKMKMVEDAQTWLQQDYENEEEDEEDIHGHSFMDDFMETVRMRDTHAYKQTQKQLLGNIKQFNSGLHNIDVVARQKEAKSAAASKANSAEVVQEDVVGTRAAPGSPAKQSASPNEHQVERSGVSFAASLGIGGNNSCGETCLRCGMSMLCFPIRAPINALKKLILHLPCMLSDIGAHVIFMYSIIMMNGVRQDPTILGCVVGILIIHCSMVYVLTFLRRVAGVVKRAWRRYRKPQAGQGEAEATEVSAQASVSQDEGETGSASNPLLAARPSACVGPFLEGEVIAVDANPQGQVAANIPGGWKPFDLVVITSVRSKAAPADDAGQSRTRTLLWGVPLSTVGCVAGLSIYQRGRGAPRRIGLKNIRAQNVALEDIRVGGSPAAAPKRLTAAEEQRILCTMGWAPPEAASPTAAGK